MAAYREAFIKDARELLETLHASLKALQADAQNADAIAEVRRMFHTLKSTSGAMGYGELSALSLTMEKLATEHVESGRAPSADALAQFADAIASVEKELETIIQS